MKTISYIILFIFCIGHSNTIAQDNYKGFMKIALQEDNGSIYTIGFDFKSEINKNIVFYGERYSGQKVNISNNTVTVDSKGMNKYHAILKINEEKNDAFKATLELFSNSIKIDKQNAKGIHQAKRIINHQIQGQLYTDNEYTFIEQDKPSLHVKLNFDKVFSMQEIKERYYRKQLLKHSKNK